MLRWTPLLLAVLLGTATLPATAGAAVRVSLVQADGDAVKVRLASSTPARVRVFARGGPVPVARARSVRLRPGRARVVALRTTARGRRALGACSATPLTLVVQRGRRARRTVARRTATAPARTRCADRGPGARQRVLFSADFGAGMLGPPTAPYPSDVDDAIAIAMALNARGLDVDGISVQFGNNQAEPATPKTREMVHDVMGRREGPIAQGAERALPPAGEPCVTDGVRLLAEQLRRGPAKVLATGPLTDVACLARTFPREAANVTEVLAQVGARPGEGVRPQRAAGAVQPQRGRRPTRDGGGPDLTRARRGRDHRLALPPGRHAALRRRARRPHGRRHAGGPLAAREQPSVPRVLAGGLRRQRPAALDQTLVHHLSTPGAYVIRDVGWRMVDCADPSGRNANPDCAGHGPSQFPTRDGEPKQLWLGDGPGQQPRAGLRVLDAYRTPGGRHRLPRRRHRARPLKAPRTRALRSIVVR
jgi:hypothetical protein